MFMAKNFRKAYAELASSSMKNSCSEPRDKFVKTAFQELESLKR